MHPHPRVRAQAYRVRAHVGTRDVPGRGCTRRATHTPVLMPQDERLSELQEMQGVVGRSESELRAGHMSGQFIAGGGVI